MSKQSDALRDFFEKNGILQKQVCEALGFTPATISNILAGRYQISKKVARKLSETYELFKNAWRMFVQIEPRLESMLVSSLDDATVQRIDKELQKRVAMTTRNTYISKLTQVTKRARAEGLLLADPGRNIHLHYTVPEHRALTVEQLRTLFAYEPRGVMQEKALALFKLSFYLRAMNSVDIIRNGRGALYDGRIRYVRAKTGKLYDFRLEPEALELLDRWCGERSLFAPYETTTNPEAYTSCYIDNALHAIARRTGLPEGLTMYWARHTLASLIIDVGYTMELAAAVLGHSYGPRVTAGYVTVQERQADAIVRRVYDYVAGDWSPEL